MTDFTTHINPHPCTRNRYLHNSTGILCFVCSTTLDDDCVYSSSVTSSSGSSMSLNTSASIIQTRMIRFISRINGVSDTYTMKAIGCSEVCSLLYVDLFQINRIGRLLSHTCLELVYRLGQNCPRRRNPVFRFSDLSVSGGAICCNVHDM